MKFDQKVFAANIRSACKLAGKPLAVVGREAGIKPSTFKRIVSPDAASVPTVDKVVAIAHALGVSVDRLILTEDEARERRERAMARSRETAHRILEQERLRDAHQAELDRLRDTLDF